MLDVDALYREHGDAIRRYFRRRLPDDEMAFDLAQDVWLRAWQHRGRYADLGAPVDAWLHRIARNLLIDHVRRHGGRVSIVRLGDLRPYVTHVGTSDHVERIAARAAIGAALATLTERQQAVIVGRFYEGRRHDQMGHVATLNGSKKLQDRALASLRRALEAA